eukprot:291794-Chlamydomonas_euryale.AAC.1
MPAARRDLRQPCLAHPTTMPCTFANHVLHACTCMHMTHMRAHPPTMPCMQDGNVFSRPLAALAAPSLTARPWRWAADVLLVPHTFCLCPTPSACAQHLLLVPHTFTTALPVYHAFTKPCHHALSQMLCPPHAFTNASYVP